MSNLIRQGDSNLAAFGQFGYNIIATGESDTSGKAIIAIQSLDDTTLVAATSEDSDIWPDISGLQLGTGVTIFGRWKDGSSTVSITGNTGKAIVYYAQY